MPADAAELLRGRSEDGYADSAVLEVLEENWTAVGVFGVCTPTLAGFGVVVGISTCEIAAAVRLLRVPRAEWPDVVRQVHFMGRCLAEFDAERQAQRRSR